jgi:TPR repeat protein
MLWEGIGCDRDLVKGLEWLQKAAKARFKKAEERLKQICLLGMFFFKLQPKNNMGHY